MADKKATRESYGAALAELGEKYDFLVLDADLAAATKTGMFKKKFPERFFDCGIAEGNMIHTILTKRTLRQLSFMLHVIRMDHCSKHGPASVLLY